MSGFDGSGNYTRAHNWAADKLASIKIQAGRMDEEDDTIAAAFNQVMLRNGVAPMTGALKMGANRITGIAAGTVGSPSVSFDGESGTGFYKPASNTFAFSVGGSEKGRFTVDGIDFTGRVTATKMTVGSTNAPRTDFDMQGIMSMRTAFEDTVISATALTGTMNIDLKTASVYMFTPNAVADFAFNLRGDASNTLDSLMAIGQTVSVAIEAPQGTTAYKWTALTVDGGAPASLKWGGNGAPLVGVVSSINVYLIRLTKTAAGQFQMRASMSTEK